MIDVAYEGLTCNVMEWLWSNGGGSFIDENKNVTINNPNAYSIFERFARFFSSGLIPPYVRLYDEGAALTKWADGEAVFMRNWPFALGETKSRAKGFNNTMGIDWDVTRMPGLDASKTAATLGGWQIAASKYTKDPVNTVKVLKFLTSERFQKMRALTAGLLPTHSKLFNDTDVCNKIGNCGLWASLDVVARPSSYTNGKYLDVSAQLYNMVTDILRSKVGVAAGLKSMTTNIEKIIGTYVEPVIDYGPPRFAELSSGSSIFILSVAALSLITAVVMSALVIKYRHIKAITASSPLFCLIMLLGVIIGLTSIFTSVGRPSNGTCTISAFLIATAFGMTMSSMIAKTWRIYMIFNNPYLKRRNIRNHHLLGFVGAIVAIEILLVGIWTAVDPLKATLVPQVTFQILTCATGSTGNSIGIALYVINGLMIVVGLFLAYEVILLDIDSTRSRRIQ